MTIHRRTFLRTGVTAGGTAALTASLRTDRRASPAQIPWESPIPYEEQIESPVHALRPVIGDGKWIFNEPPKETGYLEPRTFDLSLEMHLRGVGPARNISAFTAAPVEFPEQPIENIRIERRGCQAAVQVLASTAARFALSAETIAAGQIISAVARYRLKLAKSHMGFQEAMFPEVQEIPREDRINLGDGPGIRASSRAVRSVAKEVAGDLRHPWLIAKTFRQWVWDNIKGQHQDYTNVDTALRKRVGDCEERAAVFVALCRACNIPARLVWVPNHNWAEFMLVDEAGKPHWIPSHTSAYSWFGWTGVHELVLQKGDKIPIPGKPPARLIYDNVRCIGQRPDYFFTASLQPVAESAEDDAGPGARQKLKSGQWKLVGDHDAQKFMRV
ncbi:MAG: transglutaminase-like domain-containing protein [Planctomycetota bacterium]